MLTIAPGLELDVERGPDWLIIKMRKMDISSKSSPPIANEIWAILQQHFTYRLVLELDQAPVLNSHIIGQLVKLSRMIEEHDGVMRLCGLSAYNRRVLDACRLENRFQSYQDRQEAVMGSSRP
ncbi:MAG: STAS domain-containing protein, partial [Thermoguttaceae bacterium]